MLMLRIIFLCSLFFIAQYGWARLSPDQALHELIEGNSRFMADKCKNTQCNQLARQKTVASQFPFATILGCSDSRVPAEIVFDQGIGDLFVVRDAGGVVGDIELASIEFAVAHLHAPLIIVLGHQGCAAVKTVLQETEQNADLRCIYPLIASAIAECKQQTGGDKLKNAIYCNVRKSIQMLQSSPVIAKCLDEKKVKIVGGYYDFHSGKVNIISQALPEEKPLSQ